MLDSICRRSKGRRRLSFSGELSFPQVGESPYFLSLGAHSFYWFLLMPAGKSVERGASLRTPVQITVQEHWTNAFAGRARASLEDALIGYLKSQRWFGGKARQIKSATFVETAPLSSASTEAVITQIRGGVHGRRSGNLHHAALFRDRRAGVAHFGNISKRRTCAP